MLIYLVKSVDVVGDDIHLVYAAYTTVVTVLCVALAGRSRMWKGLSEFWANKAEQATDKGRRLELPMTEHATLEERPLAEWNHDNTCDKCRDYRMHRWWEHLLFFRWKSVEKRWWA